MGQTSSQPEQAEGDSEYRQDSGRSVGIDI